MPDRKATTITAEVSDREDTYIFTQETVEEGRGINHLRCKKAKGKIIIKESDQINIELDTSTNAKYVISEFSGIYNNIKTNHSDVTVRFDNDTILDASLKTDGKTDVKYLISENTTVTMKHVHFENGDASRVTGANKNTSKLVMYDFGTTGLNILDTNLSQTINSSIEYYSSAKERLVNIENKQITGINKHSTNVNKFITTSDISYWPTVQTEVVVLGGNIKRIDTTQNPVTEKIVAEENDIIKITINAANDIDLVDKEGTAIAVSATDNIDATGVKLERVLLQATDSKLVRASNLNIRSKGYQIDYPITKFSYPQIKWEIDRVKEVNITLNKVKITLPGANPLIGLQLIKGNIFDLRIESFNVNGGSIGDAEEFTGLVYKDAYNKSVGQIEEVYIEGDTIILEPLNSGLVRSTNLANAFTKKAVITMTIRNAIAIAKPHSISNNDIVKIGDKFATVKNINIDNYTNTRNKGQLVGGTNQSVFQLITKGISTTSTAIIQKLGTTYNTADSSTERTLFQTVNTATDGIVEINQLEYMGNTQWHRSEYDVKEGLTSISHIINRGSNYSLTLSDADAIANTNLNIETDNDTSNERYVGLTITDDAAANETIDVESLGLANIDVSVIDAKTNNDTVKLGANMGGLISIALDNNNKQAIEIDLKEYVNVINTSTDSSETIYNNYKNNVIEINDFNSSDVFRFKDTSNEKNIISITEFLAINHKKVGEGTVPTVFAENYVFVELENTNVGTNSSQWGPYPSESANTYSKIKQNIYMGGSYSVFKPTPVTLKGKNKYFLVLGSYNDASILYISKVKTDANGDIVNPIIIPIMKFNNSIDIAESQIE